MAKDILYVLIHSPLVGPFTWELVQQVLKKRNLQVVIPTLVDNPNSTLPFWQQHAQSVSQSLVQIPPDQKIILVAHSGAGPLLPAIRQKLTHSIFAYVFVDAGIPRDGLSRLELMKLEDLQWAEKFHEALLQGGQFPTWSEDDLEAIIPEGETRRKLVAEIRPHSLPFFAEPIPVQAEWPDAACIYIKFSASYDWDAMQAKHTGWLVHEMRAGHFHMLVDPAAVADMLVKTVQNLLDSAKLK